MESSAKPSSVAVCENDKLLGMYFQNSALTHSRTLMAMTESLLKNLDIKIADIDLFAVSKGPGSFTGVRIGVSAAKGLAWGAGKPICGISTLEAMAYQAPFSDMIICPVMDARRQQVYNAFFEWDKNKNPDERNLTRIKKDRAISLKELGSEMCNINKRFLFIGDASDVCYEQLSAMNIQCDLTPALLRYQTAYGVALAALNNTPVEAIILEPSYLRPSQAERVLSEKSS
jgi:tRNA threonylcarbamoyladenosine biosynthesis protein TsaB